MSRLSKTNRARWDDALRFASTMHAGQMRKGTALPYITHPIGVAEIVGRHYADKPELAIAALLHDVVEDTPATIDQITELFGAEVANLVDGVTKRNGANWRATRQMQMDKLRSAELDVVRLKVADATHNAGALLADLRSDGAGVWKRFAAGPDDVIWYYAGLEAAARTRIAGEPLLEILAGIIAGLRALAARA